jgi:hypothetical protein
VARAIFLESHPYASLYVDFADFAFWRVFVTDAYYIGGFGAARRLEIGKLIRVLIIFVAMHHPAVAPQHKIVMLSNEEFS